MSSSKKRRFAELRKQHYNMKDALQQVRDDIAMTAAVAGRDLKGGGSAVYCVVELLCVRADKLKHGGPAKHGRSP